MAAPYVKLCLIVPKITGKGETYQRVLDMPVVANFKPKKLRLYAHKDKNTNFVIIDVYIES